MTAAETSTSAQSEAHGTSHPTSTRTGAYARALSHDETADALQACLARTSHLAAAASPDRSGADQPLFGDTAEACAQHEARLAHAVRQSTFAEAPEFHRPILRRIEQSIRAIYDAVIHDAEWRRAVHVEASSRYTSAIALLAQDEAVARAHQRVDHAATELSASAEALRAYDAQPAWRRLIHDAFLTTRPELTAELESAKERFREAYSAVAEVEREREMVCREAVRQANAETEQRRRDAAALREQREAPLRAAVIQLWMAAELATSGRTLQPLSAAVDTLTLTYSGVRDERGVKLVLFRDTEGSFYADDALQHREAVAGMNFVPGDSVRFQYVSADARTLQLVARGPHLTLESPDLAGTVGALNWQGPKLVALELIDAHGNARSVVPARSDDLLDELKPGSAQLLRAGAEVRLQHGHVQLLDRLLERGGRGR